MNCSDALPLIEQMIDDETSAEQNAAVLQHVNQCVSCQSMWTDSLAIKERIRQFKCKVAVPESLMDSVRKVLEPEPLPPEPGVVSLHPPSDAGDLLDVNAIRQDLLREDIIAAFAQLSPRERDVLRLRFGIDDGRPRTLEEVAQLFGVTRERVRQLEAKALRKLRRPDRSLRFGDY